MRVLLVIDWYRVHGGAEAYITWLRRGLREAGDEVRLLTSTAGSAGDGSADYRAYGTERVAPQVLLQIVNPFAVATVRRALRTFEPDVAYVSMFALHLSPAVLYALRPVPILLGVSDHKLVCPIGSKLLPDGSICTEPAGLICWRAGCVSFPHWLRDRPRYALLRSALGRVDRVVASSRWIQEELARHAIPSEHLPLPVPAPGAGFRRAPAADPLFVFVGRLDVEKGVDLLLRAFARVRASVPRARLRIVGSGPHHDRLARLTTTLGLSAAVTFTGWLAPDQVERQLADAWALVAPSLWAEPLGLVALEAIVRGVPVIASERGGFGETVEHGVSGLLFPNGDGDALAGRMLDVAHGRALAGHAVPPATVADVADRHGVERHVARMRALFTEICDCGSR